MKKEAGGWAAREWAVRPVVVGGQYDDTCLWVLIKFIMKIELILVFWFLELDLFSRY